MPVAVWDAKYETGIEEIDSQHKNLFAAINHLAECFRARKTESGAAQALTFLNDYTKEHFDTEEEFMRVVGYPMLSHHRVEHNELLAKVQNLRIRQDEGFLITAEVAIFVADWLAHHIGEADMGYVEFIKDRLSRLD